MAAEEPEKGIVGGGLRRHPAATVSRQPQDQVEAMLGPIRQQDLGGGRRDAVLAEPP